MSRIGVHRDFVIATTDDDVGAECLAEMMQSPAQRRAGAGFIGLRPEQREQRVTPVETRRPRDGKIHEECEAFWLGEHRSHILAVRAGEAHPAYEPKSKAQCIRAIVRSWALNDRLTRGWSEGEQAVGEPGERQGRGSD